LAVFVFVVTPRAVESLPSTVSAFRLVTFVVELTVIGGLVEAVCRLSAVAPELVLALMSVIAGLAILAVSWVMLVAVFATPSRKLPPVAAKAGVTVAKASAATTISNFVALPLPQALEKLLFSFFPVALIIFVISTFFLLLSGTFFPLGK
jgi:hypothetical protein